MPLYDELDSILWGSVCVNPKNVIEGASIDQQSDEGVVTQVLSLSLSLQI